ncbi:MAG TPA: histidine kinase [Agriterribacter sp.]|nr:histidine kinase [Agriterribacter sp.]
MKRGLNHAFARQELVTTISFWAFWFCIIAVFFGTVKSSLPEGATISFILIAPQVIPVFFLSWLFDYFLNRKRLYAFFLISIPLVWIMGLLINQWFNWMIKEDEMRASNEVLLFIFAGMYIGVKYIRVAISQRMLLKEEENKRVLSELQLLRAQLNPHFLFNALNSIYSLIISHSDKAGEATLSLSELMRFHIESSRRQMVSLGEEIDMMTQFIALEKLRLGNKCTINLDTEIDAPGVEIAPLIFMPFIENAFKYSISNEASKNMINIKLHTRLHELKFEVSNSIAKSRNTLNEGVPGIGITNTKKRLDLHYKNNYELNIENTGDRFTVNLYIKLR